MPSPSSELVIALVAAVGTDVNKVTSEVAAELAKYEYQSSTFRLSDYLAERSQEPYRNKPFDEALWAAMTAGDELRESWERNDALALHGISEIVATRDENSASQIETYPDEVEPANLHRYAFILRSLKTPDELETLRAVYGPRLTVLGAYSPEDKRLSHLAEEIELSRKNRDRSTWVHQPEELIERDEKEEEVGGQDLSGTFHRADFFVRAWDTDVIKEDLERIFSILFGDPFRTPTKDEYGQFHAAGAALRSAEFGRQVGAAVARRDGSIVALGTNEVPRYGGGSHWEDDEGNGNRDFEVGDKDTNRLHFDDLAAGIKDEVIGTLDSISRELVEERGAASTTLQALRERLADSLLKDIRTGGLKDLTEFGRAVHAEMNALLDAARHGVPVAGCTLYTTTFPCHNCARHIVSAGIERVVFIEPYSKSRADELHPDSIAIADSHPGNRVSFQPFVGVAPRRYLAMFDAGTRKQLGHLAREDDQGKKQVLDKSKAVPVFLDARLDQFQPELPGYRAREILALDHFNNLTATDAGGQGSRGSKEGSSDNDLAPGELRAEEGGEDHGESEGAPPGN